MRTIPALLLLIVLLSGGTHAAHPLQMIENSATARLKNSCL
ncbi:MAG: hypothetical protein AB2812_11560 [Candidatus Sedimenticola endophacoides]